MALETFSVMDPDFHASYCNCNACLCKAHDDPDHDIFCDCEAD